MAFYIDFNFINIRDLIDLSEIDMEIEGQMESFAEALFEDQTVNTPDATSEKESSAIKFLSEAVAENDPVMTATTGKKNVADVLSAPIVQAVPVRKTEVDKNDAYIKYISNKFDQSQAGYLISVLLNPVKTNLRNRFDLADVRNGYLQSRILGKDKDSTEKAGENRRRQNEQLRTIEAERRAEILKKTELNKVFELKSKGQNSRV